MNEEPRRHGPRKVFPVRLEGVYITEKQNDFIVTEAKRRGGVRRRNAVVRDMIDFSSEHLSLFLAWIATRGISATEGTAGDQS